MRRPKLRPFWRFGLLRLFVAITVIGMCIGPIYTWTMDQKEQREQQAIEKTWNSVVGKMNEDLVVKRDQLGRGTQKVESQLDIGAWERIELVSTKEQVSSKSTGKEIKGGYLFTMHLRRCTGKGKTLWCEESYQFPGTLFDYSLPHNFHLEKSGQSMVLIAFVDDWRLRVVEVDLTRKGVFYYVSSVIKRPPTRKPVHETVFLSEFFPRRPGMSIKSIRWEGECLHVRLDISGELYHLRRSKSGDWEDLGAS